MGTGETMVSNFVDKYGIKGLNRIVYLFTRKVSNEKIAKEFEVTRQRVHQWQRAFVQTHVKPVDYVQELLMAKG